MKTLVTGANGFVGSTLCQALLRRGDKVRGLVRKTGELRFLDGIDIELFYGDLRDSRSLSKATEGIDIVYHVGALTSDWGSLELFRSMNVEGTKNILESSLASGVKRFVHISTIMVHTLLNKRNMTEESPLGNPSFPYSVSKVEAEELVMDFYKKHGLAVTIVRPGDVTGPKDRTFFLKMAKPLEMGLIPYVNRGKHLFAFTYVENLVDGIILAGTTDRAVGQAYLITDGVEMSWKQLFDMLSMELGIHKPLFSVNGKLMYPIVVVVEFIYGLLGIRQRPPVTRYVLARQSSDFHFSIEKAKRDLNYRPKISPEEAIRRTIQWYREYSKW